MPTPEPKFYVSPPLLPSALKKQYVPAKDVQSLKEDARVDEVIGEYFDEERGHFYFARYAGGIAHKVSHRILRPLNTTYQEISFMQRNLSENMTRWSRLSVSVCTHRPCGAVISMVFQEQRKGRMSCPNSIPMLHMYIPFLVRR